MNIREICVKVKNVAIVSKFGSKISEDAAVVITKKLVDNNSKVITISPVQVSGAKQVESLEELSKMKLDLVITL